MTLIDYPQSVRLFDEIFWWDAAGGGVGHVARLGYPDSKPASAPRIHPLFLAVLPILADWIFPFVVQPTNTHGASRNSSQNTGQNRQATNRSTFSRNSIRRNNSQASSTNPIVSSHAEAIIIFLYNYTSNKMYIYKYIL